jgi:acetyl-CoA acetyltransferase
MSEPFRNAELVTVTIAVAEVVRVETDEGERYLCVQTTEGVQIMVPLDSKAVTVQRLAPPEWPPQVGDLWRDKHGDLWFAYIQPLTSDSAPDRIFMRTATGGRWSDGYDGQIADNGPWTLVHREPATSGGETG